MDRVRGHDGVEGEVERAGGHLGDDLLGERQSLLLLLLLLIDRSISPPFDSIEPVGNGLGEWVDACKRRVCE